MQQRYIKLIKEKKYNIGIATLLLVVYAFIATPVQLWHHHAYVANQSFKTTDKKDVSNIYTSAQQTIADANCAVCSHVYPAYSFVPNISFETSFFVLQPKIAFYILAIPFSPLLNSTNKGPPTLTA